MARLTAHTLPIARVSAPERDAMWAVFERHYEDVTRARFDADLAEKDHVILLRDGPAVRGFSTVCVRPMEVDGRSIVSVYSGDTVLDDGYRGQTALHRAFFWYVLAARLRHPSRLVVWFLISKGYKTYLLLARNFPTFWPRRDAETPAWARTLVTTLARERFGDALDEAALVLRVAHGRLRRAVAPLDGLDDPDIRYFATANPNHADGEELCCIGVVDAAFVFGFPVRVLRKLLRLPGAAR
ncbi:MAG: hypothetical protein Q8P41_01765 [Pseudomonadota bacterium]|nr:hypothetical protein [Pseudomonadota bacterium]